MMKKYFIIVILIALLLTACSQKKAKETESTKDTAAPTANITAETEEVTIDYYALIEEETAVPPTVADDLNYYEMYQKAKEEEREYIRNYKDGTIPNVYGERGAQYAKEWKSTDGRISFVLDTELGPYDQYLSPFELEPEYTVNGKKYTNMELDLNRNSTNDDSTSFCLIKWSEKYKCTIVLSGSFEYDHDEQSFTVTADPTILYEPYVPGSGDEDTDKTTVEEWNKKFGDPDVPCYQEGEKVTFKMVR